MTDYNWITSRLATGAALDASCVPDLTAAGITHCVNCRSEDDTEDAFLPPTITKLWNPTDDDGAPKDERWWHTGIAFVLGALIEPHTRILVHCAAGVNRGPSLAYGCMLALGWPADAAEAMIRAARPQVGLAYAADARVKVPALGWC